VAALRKTTNTSVRTLAFGRDSTRSLLQWLMLFGETVAVYCENRTEHRYSPYLTGNTLHLRYRAQPVNAV
jgi:hypothetical protein